MLHAGRWYGAAAEGVPAGPARTKIEKRLAEIAKLLAPGCPVRHRRFAVRRQTGQGASRGIGRLLRRAGGETNSIGMNSAYPARGVQ